MHSFETRVTQSVAIVPANAPNLALFMPLARERADVCGLGHQVSDNDHDALDRCDSDWEGLLPWQVRRVRDCIEAGLHGRVSLSAAAGQARLSPGYFSRCFRRAFGVTFSRFVAGKRVERAQRLMLEGGRQALSDRPGVRLRRPGPLHPHLRQSDGLYASAVASPGHPEPPADLEPRRSPGLIGLFWKP